MRILVLHNRYRERGGEDTVAESEVNLLRSHGCEVLFLQTDNEADPQVELRGALALGLHAHWSRRSYEHIRAVCREFRPDVAHVHNFWLRFTPAVHKACRDEGVPTVQTLHNFRLFCTNALFQRAGRRCERCLGRSPWRGVVLRCYRDSFLASATAARMIMSNRARKTWTEHVSAFIALSRHSRQLFVAGGIPEGRIRVKPNFAEDRGNGSTPPSACGSFVFAGRLSPEKGAESLLQGWKAAGIGGRAQLLIAGDGPERGRLEEAARQLGIAAEVSFLGHIASERMPDLLGQARAVILPSLFHECFPRTLVEAMSLGRPVLASSVGALDELVQADMGLQFEPQDSIGMARCIRRLLDDPLLADRFGIAARAGYLARYTPEANFTELMDIYQFAMGRPSARNAAQAVGAAI